MQPYYWNIRNIQSAKFITYKGANGEREEGALDMDSHGWHVRTHEAPAHYIAQNLSIYNMCRWLNDREARPQTYEGALREYTS